MKWIPPTPEEELDNYVPGRFRLEFDHDHEQAFYAVRLAVSFHYQALIYHNADEVCRFGDMGEMFDGWHRAVDLEEIKEEIVNQITGVVGQFTHKN